MKRTIIPIALGIAALLAPASVSCTTSKAADRQTGVDKYHTMGYVVVTPNGPKDGGDFGPHTPGTKTSGLQEAFDYAQAQSKDIYIAGGGISHKYTAGAVYYLSETLRIPWMQNFRLDGGEYFISYKSSHGDAVVIDSQMNCHYKFGLITSSSDGAVVRLKPETKGPDKFSCITCSTFEFNGLVGSGSIYPGKDVKGRGIGLLLDGSSGSISANRITSGELNACDIGLYVTQGCSNNRIQVPLTHLCNIHVQLGDPDRPVAVSNVIDTHINSEGISESVGALIYGQRNLLTLDVQQTAPGKNVVFGPTARDNIVTALNLPNGVTNNASVPNNRIIAAETGGFSVQTPSFPPSGEHAANLNPFPVEVIFLTTGSVSAWTLTDANGVSQTISSALFAGQSLGFVKN
ncbi:MAG: hypothetical protein HYX78_15755 [Armatimonadetes bacterium]|nr:hypothetical protein [Armatimonadota bacterium]